LGVLRDISIKKAAIQSYLLGNVLPHTRDFPSFILGSAKSDLRWRDVDVNILKNSNSSLKKNTYSFKKNDIVLKIVCSKQKISSI